MPGPDWRKCTVYRQTGHGGPPLGLGLNEGLGLTWATLACGTVSLLLAELKLADAD